MHYQNNNIPSLPCQLLYHEKVVGIVKDTLERNVQNNKSIFFQQMRNQQNPLQKYSSLIKPPDETNYDFLLANYISDYDQLALIKFYYPPTMNRSIFKNCLKKNGKPKCITSSYNYIVFGMSRGTVLIYNINDPLQPPKIIQPSGTYGIVSSISIKDQMIIICYENGAIGIYNLEINQLLFTFQDIHNTRILLSRIVFKNKKYSDRLSTITSDQYGFIYLTRFQNGLINYEYQTQMLLKQQDHPVMAIEVLSEQKIFDYFEIKDEDKESSSDDENDPLCMKFSIVGMANAKRVWIAKIFLVSDYPIDLLYNVANPHEPSLTTCCLSWGEGIIKEDQSKLQERKLFLSISWNNNFYLIYLKNLKYGYIQSKKLEFKSTIICLNNASQNVLVVICRNEGAYILNTVHLNIMDNDSHIDDQKTLLYKEIIQYRIMSQIYEKDEYFGCSFGFRNMELLFLGESKFIVSRIIDWQEICDDLLERGEWLMVMALLISIKDNQNKLIPVKDDDEFNESYLQKVSEISNEYIELIIKQKEQNNDEQMLDNMLLILIEFLLFTDNQQCLYNVVVKQLFEIFGNINIFADQFKQFLKLPQIGYIPTDLLDQLVNYYKQLDNKDLMNLLLSLNYNEYQNNHLIQICLENNQLEALIKICNQKEDYITPLIRLWQLALQSHSSDYIMKALYYIQYCLQKKHELISKQISEIFFDQQMIVNCLLHNPWATSLVLIQFFCKNISIYFQHNYTDIINPTLESIQEQFFYQASQSTFEYFFILVQDCFANFIHKLTIKNKLEEINHIHQIFFSEVYLQSIFNFKPHKLFSCIEYFLCNSQIFDYIPLPQYIDDDWDNHQELIDFHLQNYVCILISKLQYHHTNFYQDHYQQLINQSETTNYYQITATIYQLNRNIQKTLDYYLRSPNNYFKQKVFTWLNTVLPEAQQLFISKLPQLILINLEFTKLLVTKYFQGQHYSIIEQLKDQPQLQLDYLENLNYQGPELYSILKLHIQLVCQYKPDKALKILRQQNYPLDESLQLTQKYKIHDATAFLYERSGAISESVKEWFMTIEELIRQYFQNEDHQMNLKQLKTTLWNYLNEIIKLLIRNQKYEYADLEWYTVLNKILECQQWMKKQKGRREKQEMNQLFEDMTEKIVENVCIHSSIGFFIDQLYTTYSSLGIGKMKVTFMNLYGTLMQQMNVLLAAKDLMVIYLLKQRKRLNCQLSQGQYVFLICFGCEEEVADELYKIYNCCHGFHMKCSKEYCYECTRAIEHQFEYYSQKCKSKQKEIKENVLQVHKKEQQLVKNKIQTLVFDRQYSQTEQISQHMKYINILDKFDKLRNQNITAQYRVITN